MSQLLQLFKYRISFLTALSGGAGYLMSGRVSDIRLILLLISLFLLAGSACAINQVQDFSLDSKMKRTRHRPLPSGRISQATALWLATVSLLSGSYLLYYISPNNALPLFLGLFAVFWYNVVYTYLKRKSAFAAIPGALTGALPPCIGWIAAGGDPLATTNIVIMIIMFLWQIPHTWLLMLIHGDDFDRVGLPTPRKFFFADQFARITFTWLQATVFITLLLPLYGIIQSIWIYLLLVLIAVWTGLQAIPLTRSPVPEKCAIRRTLMYSNCFTAMVLFLVVFDHSLL